MSELKFKHCSRCDQTLDIEQFKINRARGRNPHRYHICRDCDRARKREEYARALAKKSLEAYQSIPCPCDTCPHADYCKATGYSCLAFQQFVETGTCASPDVIERIVQEVITRMPHV